MEREIHEMLGNCGLVSPEKIYLLLCFLGISRDSGAEKKKGTVKDDETDRPSSDPLNLVTNIFQWLIARVPVYTVQHHSVRAEASQAE